MAVDFEDQTLCECRNEIPAFRRAAVIDNSKSEIFEIRIQSDAEEDDVQGRGDDQHDDQTAIPPDLVKLLNKERPDAQVQYSFQHRAPLKRLSASAS